MLFTKTSSLKIFWRHSTCTFLLRSLTHLTKYFMGGSITLTGKINNTQTSCFACYHHLSLVSMSHKSISLSRVRTLTSKYSCSAVIHASSLQANIALASSMTGGASTFTSSWVQKLSSVAMRIYLVTKLSTRTKLCRQLMRTGFANRSCSRS